MIGHYIKEIEESNFPYTFDINNRIQIKLINKHYIAYEGSSDIFFL